MKKVIAISSPSIKPLVAIGKRLGANTTNMMAVLEDVILDRTSYEFSYEPKNVMSLLGCNDFIKYISGALLKSPTFDIIESTYSQICEYEECDSFMKDIVPMIKKYYDSRIHTMLYLILMDSTTIGLVLEEKSS